MSIQYPALGFELTTFGMWVSSHNHQTRAPARNTNSYSSPAIELIKTNHTELRIEAGQIDSYNRTKNDLDNINVQKYFIISIQR